MKVFLLVVSLLAAVASGFFMPRRENLAEELRQYSRSARLNHARRENEDSHVRDNLRDMLARGTPPRFKHGKGHSKFTRTVAECGDKQADIIFVLDESSSIWNPHFVLQLTFVEDVIEDFDVGDNKTHIGVITFSTKNKIHFQLQEKLGKAELKKAVQAIQQQGGETYTYDALERLRTEMFVTPHIRSWVPHIAVVITDGQSFDKVATLKQAQMCKDAGIVMFAIGVNVDSDTFNDELEGIASGPDYVFTVEDYTALDAIKDQLANATCKVTTTTTTTTPAPTTTKPQSIVSCDARYPFDLVFSLSDQTGVRDTDLAVNFVQMVVEELEMGSGQALVGLTPRGCDHDAEAIKLNQHDTLDAFFETLETRRLYSAPTHAHLNYLLERSMSAEQGAREKSAKFGVVVIDNASEDVDKTLDAARAAKDGGVHLMVIGVGEYVAEEPLGEIASSDDDWFTVDSYDEIETLKQDIINRLCDVLTEYGK